MAGSRTTKKVEWYYPEERGILPLDNFHVPKSLAKIARKVPYTITMDKDFRGVISACADAPREKDGGTWINDEIIDSYCALHAQGHAHSVEVWSVGGQQTNEPSAREAAPHVSASRRAAGATTLVGGLYGVSLGRAFFGESMFSTAPNASKLALVHLVSWLRANGYTLLDTQYVNDHLLQFGVLAIARKEYLKRLAEALKNPLS